MIISKHDPELKFSLVEESRTYLRKVWNQYDVTIYMEDDVIVDYSHVVGYLSELSKLQQLVGTKIAFDQYYIGFQRYRRHLKPMEKMRLKTTEEDNFHQEYLEEIPFFKPVCINNAPYLHVLGNKRTPAASVYQGMWILTQAQIRSLQSKCSFLDQTFRNVHRR